MRKNYTLGFAFSADRSKVALMMKNRPAWQAGKMNGIGGKLEENESPNEAMVREFFEETGVKTDIADWHYYTKIVGRDGDVYCYRMFNDKVFDVKTTSDEDVVLLDTSLDIIRQKALSNVAWLIGIALDDNQPIFFVEANYNQEFITGKTGTDNG